MDAGRGLGVIECDVADACVRVCRADEPDGEHIAAEGGVMDVDGVAGDVAEGALVRDF